MKNKKANLRNHPSLFSDHGFASSAAIAQGSTEETPANSDPRPTTESVSSVYTIEYCLDYIKNEKFIWDLRFWNFAHRRGEVSHWVFNLFANGPAADPKNCGHAAFCIHTLLIYHNYEPDQITDLILKNNHTTYHNEIGALADPLKLNKPMKSICKQCQTQIQFIRTVNGRLMPAGVSLTTLKNARELKPKMKFLITASGESVMLPESIGYIPHWNICDNPNRFRRKK